MARWRPRVPRAALAGLLVTVVVAMAASCAGEPPCRFNSDCDDAYCSDGVCKQDCLNASLDCPSGFVCNAVAQCAPPDGGTAPVPDGGAQLDAGDPDTGSDAPIHHDAVTAPDAPSRPDSGADAPHDATAGDTTSTPDAFPDTSGPLGTTLDLCTGDGTCAAGLLCRPEDIGGTSRCTPICTDTSECPTGDRCVTVGAEEYCVLSDVGRTCTASTNCNFGCLTGPAYCTMPCSSGSDCPNGYGCEAVGTPSVSVCVKAEVPCDTDTSGCIAAAACDTSATLVVASCTLACTTASDCPQRAAGFDAWTCDGLCRRPPDVYGPLPQGSTPAQYACDGSGTVVNLCNDAQHIDFVAFDIPGPPAVSCSATTTTAGIATDSCVDSCTYQGGCAFGYACTALGSVNGGGARVGLCLPALGGGEIGASCASSDECAFGYCNTTSGTCSRDCTADDLCTTGSTCTASGSIPVEGLPFKRCQ